MFPNYSLIIFHLQYLFNCHILKFKKSLHLLYIHQIYQKIKKKVILKNEVQPTHTRAAERGRKILHRLYPLSIERGWNSGYPTSTPLHRGLMLAACEPGRRGLQVAKRRAGEKRETQAGKQTATRAPRETVRVPSSARQGSVRVLLLARTLQEHPSEDRPRDRLRTALLFFDHCIFSIPFHLLIRIHLKKKINNYYIIIIKEEIVGL